MRDSAPLTAHITVSVSRLANYLAKRLANDQKLRRLGVSGEISGYSAQTNGTIYFDLKDRDALIRCVAWSETAAGLPMLANGQAIVAIGSVGTYAKKSTYQLTVYAVEFEGAGRLHALYEALKRRLESEGLFALERKRPLPAHPFHVALISSRSANGAGDFLMQAALLAPHIRIELFETPVQGQTAVPDIVRAIERASRSAADVVVIARGGGSYEDLFVFNDERVVRALARCAHPTVSAIGHEADTLLTDLVADVRAATPSSAAQMHLPKRADLLRSIALCTRGLDRCVARNLDRLGRDLARIEIRSPLATPNRTLLARRQAVDTTANELQRAFDRRLRRRRDVVAALRARLEACNPSLRLSYRRERLVLARYQLGRAARDAVARSRRRCVATTNRLEPAANAALEGRRSKLRFLSALAEARDPTKILQRGYAIVSVDGVPLRDAASVTSGTLITARVARGTLGARVESVSLDGGE